MSEQIINQNVNAVFCTYPSTIQQELLTLRKLLFKTAYDIDPNLEIVETLKWGEASYLCKTGSTIRLAWHQSKPDVYGIYFNCKSLLVPTFKEIYADEFIFETNRAIIIKSCSVVPSAALKHCFALALTYHKIKHLPLLGA